MSFINPIYLIAAAGALIPLIIHLTRKQRAKKIPFSSLIFLKASPRELIKRRRLRDLILLIIRSAILALLAFVFARPFFPKEKIQLNAGEEDKSIVILADNSYSMSYGSSLERLKEEAKDIVDNSGSRDEISIIVFSDFAQQLIPFTIDKGILRNSIEQNIRPSYRTTDYYNSLQLCEELLRNANNPQRVVMMVSDFQDYAFSSQFQQWKLDPNITFIPVNIAQDKVTNSFINKFHLKQSKTNKIKAAEFKAEIAGIWENENSPNTCFLNISNEETESRNLTSGSSQAFFQKFDLKKGSFQGNIAISEDNLEADNRYYFTFEVTDLPSILCIDGKPSVRQNDNFFLKSAFDLGDASIFKYSTTTTAGISKNNLQNYDMVIMANIRTLSNNRVSSIEEYVSDGGNVIFSFGDNINTGSASSIIQRFGIGELINENDIQNSSVKDAIITDVNFRHPVFSLFVESGTGELFRPKFRRYLEISPDSSASVLGSYDSGHPFLIEKKHGKGRIFVYTSSFNTSWTDFPVHDIYVPFLYQLAEYAVSEEENRSSYLVGQTVLLRGNSGETWEIVSPDNNKSIITIDETGFARFAQTDIPGNYYAVSNSGSFYFSVNVDIKESDLTYRNSEEAFSIVSKEGENKRMASIGSVLENDRDEERNQKIWKYLLMVIILVFAFETFYANKSFKKENRKE
ncbi:BatA domain-containing protein [candidate division KSB1 bacterium]